MEYKGYTATAEIETYETWSLNEQGEPVNRLSGGGVGEVTGYSFTNEETGDDFSSYQYIDGEHNFTGEPEAIRELIDDRIAELAERAAA